MTTNASPASITAACIKSQIGANTLMCIGAHALFVVPETISKDENGHLGGLCFKINPNPKMKLHGTVFVTLQGNDTYHVKIMTCRGKVMLDLKDVYCDQLGGRGGVIEQVTG
jgi:hypothetical protein